MIGPYPFLMAVKASADEKRIAALTVENIRLQDENTRLAAEVTRLGAEVARLRSNKDRREIWP